MGKELLNNKEKFQPLIELENLTRVVASEGLVLLKNENQTLPLVNKTVAVFGRIQTNYYKSGTGSGGLVNVKHVPSLLEALEKSPLIKLNDKLKNIYLSWIKDNPFNEGNGQWASEPWSQVEMDISDELVKEISLESEVALVVIGRTAGEDRDHFNGPGSYLLTKSEEELINKTTKHFKRVVVVLTVGNTIDTSWINKYNVDSLIYAFSGGMHGANAIVDVLTGLVAPSGKLPNTIAYDISDYPSNRQFGHKEKVIYEEDIYVGYRFFETFAEEKVLFPFGFGLSYTTFSLKTINFEVNHNELIMDVEVLNNGNYEGKEVVQIYLEAPNGLLGKPKKVLVGFHKTKLLVPGEKTVASFKLDINNFSSFDDYGYILKNAYVLEKGQYILHVGNNIRDISDVNSFELKNDIVTEFLSEAGAPKEAFKRIKRIKDKIAWVDVPLKTIDVKKVVLENVPELIKPNNKNYHLIDVYNKKISLDTFIGSLSPLNISELVRGEGMSSPKVTPGTAAAFGGVTNELLDKGIPIMCAADGPSGIRIDAGMYATSLPSGTLLAATFNTDLVEYLYEFEGYELRNYNIDMLLGPGMNINRHPLNGRNFEYFSEDPLLTGMMAAAVVNGLNKAGVSGSLKHLTANNQETDRFNVNAVISQRALREIYLKGFEIAVKTSNVKAIMTSYNPVNGIWTASNYEINKMIVRDEWKYQGILITDWWAKMNEEGEEGNQQNTKAMIISEHDLYMVVPDSKSNPNNDNTISSFDKKELSLSQLQRVAKNIVKYALNTPAFYNQNSLQYNYQFNRKKQWFETNTNSNLLPTMNNIYINNKKIELVNGIYMYELEEESINKVETTHNYTISENNKELIIKVINDNYPVVYQFSCKSKTVEKTHNFKFEPLHKINSNAWHSNIIKLFEYVNKSKHINFEENKIFTSASRQEITYAIEIVEESKYVFEFDVEVESLELAQVPFSIFINGKHKSTLTLRNTNKKIIKAKAFIILDKGLHHMTLNFNKSGITLYQVNILRHG